MKGRTSPLRVQIWMSRQDSEEPRVNRRRVRERSTTVGKYCRQARFVSESLSRHLSAG